MSALLGSKSLGWRIRLTVLGAAAVALLLACGAFLAYQQHSARDSLREEVKTLANVVSIHSILPLASGEAEGAEVTLLALGESPTIEAAVVYTKSGAVFAQFLRDYDHGAPIPASPGQPRQAFRGSTLEVVAEIRSGDERIGSVYLRASTDVLATRALHHLSLGCAVFALASIPGLLASERLRRRIATPLAAMAETAEAFAVVAERVGELANGAADSSREIAVVIERVQASTRAAVVAVNAASGKVEHGVALSNEAGEILGRIARGSEESSATIASIASAVAGQIGELDRVRSAAQEARAGVAQIRGAVDEHQRASAAIVRAMEQARELGLSVKLSTQEQTREGRRIAGVAEEIEALTRHVRDATDVQRTSAEETLAALGVFRNTTELATAEAATLHGLVEMLAARSTLLAQQIDRFHFEDAAVPPAPVAQR